MSQAVEKIKDRLSITDVVGSYVRLDKAGRNFKARCPFHNEKTPSFFVSPERNTYHCFGCNKGGDMFSFVQDIEGIDFLESLKILGERAGVDVEFKDPRAKGERERQFAILESATQYFENGLSGSRDALSYLKKRGINTATIRAFRIGFIEDSWRSLYAHLKQLKYTDAELVASGLVISKDTGTQGRIFYDRFRGRIMFPITNTQSKIIGFSGRLIAPSTEGRAKYVNSPQTELFDKSSVLYGYSHAKESIRNEGKVLIVEGQMDVILAHQAGFSNTVGVSGTALTQRHISLIRRLAMQAIFALDADDAGTRALVNGARLALSAGVDATVVEIPAGSDPADEIAKDKALWATRVKEAKPIIEYLLDICEDKGIDARGFKREVKKYVLPLLTAFSDKIEKGHFIELVARRIGVPESFIHEELQKLIHHDSLGVEEPQDEPQAKKKRGERIVEQIVGIYIWQSQCSDAEVPLDDIRKQFDKHMKPQTLDDIVGNQQTKERSRLSFETEILYKDSLNLKDVLSELFSNLEEEILKEKLSNTLISLRHAEQSQDEKKAEDYLKKCKSISERLNELRVHVNLHA